MNSLPRSTTLQTLKSTQFDVVVIGGGVSGAWITLHCSLMGFKVAMIDRGDFAGETSSASSKLLHGGIRYLQQLQFGKVRESTMERAAYLYAAPHLSQPIPFLVPTYRDLKRSKLLLRSGLAAYRMLGTGQNAIVPCQKKHISQLQNFNAEQLNNICDISHLNHTGGIAFTEFHMYDSERTVWAIIESARESGAIAANYVAATQIEIQDNIASGIKAVDVESGEQFSIQSRLTINAAGPWVDNLNSGIKKQGDKSGRKPLIQNYAAGAHVITKQLSNEYAIAISTKAKSVTTIDRGGRHIFIIPWRGYSLIGTSYRETEDPDSTHSLNNEDLHQLLEAVNDTLPNAHLTSDDIVSSYIGLYPLSTNAQLATTYQGSGEYRILDHSIEDGIEGLITSLGAKFTTGRILAERTTKLAAAKLTAEPSNVQKTHKCKLFSAQYDSLEAFTDFQLKTLKGKYSESQIRHFIHTYGSNIDDFIEFIETHNDTHNMSIRLVNGQPDILGQIAWAIEKEMALHLDDVLLRRTSLGLLGITNESVSKVADLMADRLGWSVQHKDKEVTKVRLRQDNIRNTAVDFYREA